MGEPSFEEENVKVHELHEMFIKNVLIEIFRKEKRQRLQDQLKQLK